MTTSSSLTGRFAGLAANDLVAVLDAFAFVWIRLAQRTNVRGRLSDFLFVSAGDGDVSRLRVDGNVDSLRNREAHGMRISQLEHHFFPLHLGAISDADDVELFLEAFADAADVVRHERAHKTVKCPGLVLFVFAREVDDVVFDIDANAGDDRRAQSPFGALHSDDAAVLFHFDAFRQLNRFLTNARHGNVLIYNPG